MAAHPHDPLYSGYLYVKGDGIALFGGHSWKRQFTTLSHEGRLAFSGSPRDRIAKHDSLLLSGARIRVVPHEKYDNHFVVEPAKPAAARSFRAASSFALADLLGRIAECREAGGAAGCSLDSGNLLRDDGVVALMSPRSREAVRAWCGTKADAFPLAASDSREPRGSANVSGAGAVTHSVASPRKSDAPAAPPAHNEPASIASMRDAIDPREMLANEARDAAAKSTFFTGRGSGHVLPGAGGAVEPGHGTAANSAGATPDLAAVHRGDGDASSLSRDEPAIISSPPLELVEDAPVPEPSSAALASPIRAADVHAPPHDRALTSATDDAAPTHLSSAADIQISDESVATANAASLLPATAVCSTPVGSVVEADAFPATPAAQDGEQDPHSNAIGHLGPNAAAPPVLAAIIPSEPLHLAGGPVDGMPTVQQQDDAVGEPGNGGASRLYGSLPVVTPVAAAALREELSIVDEGGAEQGPHVAAHASSTPVFGGKGAPGAALPEPVDISLSDDAALPPPHPHGTSATNAAPAAASPGSVLGLEVANLEAAGASLDVSTASAALTCESVVAGGGPPGGLFPDARIVSEGGFSPSAARASRASSFGRLSVGSGSAFPEAPPVGRPHTPDVAGSSTVEDGGRHELCPRTTRRSHAPPPHICRWAPPRSNT